MKDEPLEVLKAARDSQYELIEPAEIRWKFAENAEQVAREELHQIRLRFQRLCFAIETLEGKR